LTVSASPSDWLFISPYSHDRFPFLSSPSFFILLPIGCFVFPFEPPNRRIYHTYRRTTPSLPCKDSRRAEQALESYGYVDSQRAVVRSRSMILRISPSARLPGVVRHLVCPPPAQPGVPVPHPKATLKRTLPHLRSSHSRAPRGYSATPPNSRAGVGPSRRRISDSAGPARRDVPAMRAEDRPARRLLFNSGRPVILDLSCTTAVRCSGKQKPCPRGTNQHADLLKSTSARRFDVITVPIDPRLHARHSTLKEGSLKSRATGAG